MFSGLLRRSSSLAFVSDLLPPSRELLRLGAFHTGGRLQKNRDKKNGKRKRSFWPWSRRKDNDDDKLKIIETARCDQSGDPILDPECKVAIVLGGVTDVGLSAADSLLYNGARAVVLADEDSRAGENAAQSLCDFYGKKRARFLRCDLKIASQLEGVFEETICRYKAVHVLFNNLDRNNGKVWPGVNCEDKHNEKAQWSNTMRAIHTGMRYMAKNTGGAGGIIINGATIIGFMGWPGDPTPVYCFKEPVAETTIDLAKTYSAETTGVRIVALLKSQKPFDQIGLPDFPVSQSKIDSDFSQLCEPSAESRIGKALVHLMARARTGTIWLSEPAPCLREIPWLIHFPSVEGEPVDPRIYEKQNYSSLNSSCVAPPTGHCPENCEETRECKIVWKTSKR